ncbi:PREDICTED: uncharacterized protein LOC108779505 [Cyphomyrmex costatus]|uniref:uncharacterized protein LOC108779505 n=1 Tax=Cyphomyrmex costatus TaxID=456900 RepID=UPI0008522C93|nr:PREDICTED: uncharacterized protein LOC108779505 [Cyphomyrmex costatus]
MSTIRPVNPRTQAKADDDVRLLLRIGRRLQSARVKPDVGGAARLYGCQVARRRDRRTCREKEHHDNASGRRIGKSAERSKNVETKRLIGMLVVLLCIMIGGTLFPYPLHASCIVKWRFDDPCSHVMQKFRRQITNWSSWNTCRQRDDTCQYTLKLPVENNIIRATHRTSKSLERIEIVFEEMNNTCFAKAASVSSGWFTIFDYGTNYCNLHNLIVGAGLDRHAKFQELTNDAVCTQFNMAVC